MTDVALGLAVLAALLCAAWLSADLRTLPVEPRRRPGVSSVSVVVPARDEEASIATLVRSLDGLEVDDVVVVDDGSSDGTAAVALAAGARVLPAGHPPSGWTGKAWACHVGARATDSDLILFLDADTTMSAGALAGLHELYEQHGGLVSVQPFHTVRLAHEQLSAYFNLVSVLGSGAFARRPAVAPMAFGPCLLTSRADYLRVGGHAAVRAEVLDDVRLARAYSRAGLPVRCATGGRALTMRSYPDGWRQLVGGWTKNMASGASAAMPGPALATVAWISAHHAVAVGACLSLVEGATGLGTASAGHPALWAVAWVAVAAQLRFVLRRLGSFRWWAWAVFPVPLLVFDLVFARSLVRTVVHRSVRWRGREVDLRDRAPAGPVA